MFSIEYNNFTDDFFGIRVVRRPNIPVAEKDIEDVTVKGADETLTRDKGLYKNIEISVEYNFIDTNDFQRKCRRIKKWLCGTVNNRILRFSDDYDVFYKVKNVKIGNIERQWEVLGKFTVVFVCSPYAWLNEGEVVMNIPNNGTSLYNDSLLSYPEIIIEGNGTVLITMNGCDVEATVVDRITLNTQYQKAYRDSKVVSLPLTKGSYEDLYLQEEENSISWKTLSGNIESVELIPHYKTL